MLLLPLWMYLLLLLLLSLLFLVLVLEKEVLKLLLVMPPLLNQSFIKSNLLTHPRTDHQAVLTSVLNICLSLITTARLGL